MFVVFDLYIQLNDMFRCCLISRSRFEIDVPFDANCVGLFKTIPSKSYNMTTRKWSFDLSNYDELCKFVFEFDGFTSSNLF